MYIPLKRHFFKGNSFFFLKEFKNIGLNSMLEKNKKDGGRPMHLFHLAVLELYPFLINL